MDQRNSMESQGSVHVQIYESSETTTGIGGRITAFVPGVSIDTKDSSTSNSVSPNKGRPAVNAPEKKLTLFALRLAVLEKAATGLGALGFIWATVVLLGGFAITLDKTDFWFITVILLIEGTRIFSRSHELEWQHQATTWSIAEVGISSFRAIKSSPHVIADTIRATFRPPISTGRYIDGDRSGSNKQEEAHPTRTWASSDVPLLPYAPWVFISRNVSKVLYWLQLASATACIALSLMKLIRHDYGEVEKGETDKRNRKAALNIFYSLSLAEALLFLLEKVYWEWKVICCKLLEQVNRECELGNSGLISIKRFFYDAYSKCVNGSIFDGLKMDMVAFGMELLCSNSPDEQLVGVRILLKFATNRRFSNDTLQKIGINLSVMERLVEMLNWKDSQEEEIRKSAAEVLSALAGKKQNSLRVAGIPGAMESISSLLHVNRGSLSAADEIFEKRLVFDNEGYSFWTFNQLGLLILKKLARDHDNCGKIGHTRGLLPKIIDFTHAGERLLTDERTAASQILTVKRSLQVVKMLASTTGETGKQLRKEISEVVFTISNIRDILRYGERYPALQKLGIEILTSLAVEEEASERIGATGGVLKELFNVFLKEDMPEKQNQVRTAAGEALAMLALETKQNCHRIIKMRAVERLVAALETPLLRIAAARILRNLCSYSGSTCFERLKGITVASPTVVRAIMMEENKLQEVMVGLAAHAFKFMTTEETRGMFETAGIGEGDLAGKLVQILRESRYPSIKIPRIRRFAIELAIWMMRDKRSSVGMFRDLGMEKELESLIETTSELESFNIFSGTVGLSRHRITIHSLVETALALLLEDDADQD